MASPHVAGVAALIKSAAPSKSNIDIRTILETTAEDLGTLGWDESFGYGLVDAYAAIVDAINFNSGNEMFIRFIKLKKLKKLKQIKATIKVKSTNGKKVPFAKVSVAWSGNDSSKFLDNATTNENGIVVFTIPILKNGNHSITVEKVFHPKLNYNKTLNFETTEEIRIR